MFCLCNCEPTSLVISTSTRSLLRTSTATYNRVDRSRRFSENYTTPAPDHPYHTARHYILLWSYWNYLL